MGDVSEWPKVLINGVDVPRTVVEVPSAKRKRRRTPGRYRVDPITITFVLVNKPGEPAP